MIQTDLIFRPLISMRVFFWLWPLVFSAAAMTASLRVDLQAAAGPLHRQRGRTHAETGGAGRPASCPLQTHLPTVLPRFASLSAGLP